MALKLTARQRGSHVESASRVEGCARGSLSPALELSKEEASP